MGVNISELDGKFKLKMGNALFKTKNILFMEIFFIKVLETLFFHHNYFRTTALNHKKIGRILRPNKDLTRLGNDEKEGQCHRISLPMPTMRMSTCSI